LLILDGFHYQILDGGSVAGAAATGGVSAGDFVFLSFFVVPLHHRFFRRGVALYLVIFSFGMFVQLHLPLVLAVRWFLVMPLHRICCGVADGCSPVTSYMVLLSWLLFLW